MTAERCRRAARLLSLAAMALIGAQVPLSAQSRLWLASLNYESSTELFAPVIALHSADGEGHEWNLWLSGWTIGADRSVAHGPRRRLQLLVRVTPINAHGSNYVYVDGRRDPSASFGAASLDVAAGFEVRHTRRWTGSYRVVGLHEHVGRTLPLAIRRSWDHPFAGVDVGQAYARVRAESLFGARWEGFKADASAQVYTGDRTWSRVQASAGAGKRLGPVLASGRAALFAGEALNTVSAFVLGGSWDLAPPDLLPGYRYSEFRVKRAATIRGGVDTRIRGAWEIGVRGTYLAKPDGARRGAALQMTNVWRGALFQGGVALPADSGRPDGRHAVFFGTVTAAVIQR